MRLEYKLKKQLWLIVRPTNQIKILPVLLIFLKLGKQDSINVYWVVICQDLGWKENNQSKS